MGVYTQQQLCTVYGIYHVHAMCIGQSLTSSLSAFSGC